MAKASTRAELTYIKTASVCKGGTSKQHNNNEINKMIMKTKEKRDTATTNVAWLNENGNKMRAIFSRRFVPSDKPKEKIQSLNKSGVKKSKTRIAGTSELISRKSKASMEMINNILKSELMINDVVSKPSTKKLPRQYFNPFKTSQYQNPISTEYISGISSPESWDSNSDKKKQTKAKPVKPSKDPIRTKIRNGISSQDPMSTEIRNGISSPESLDNNSNRIKKNIPKLVKPSKDPMSTKIRNGISSQDPMSTEISNGISSPESLDSNSNRIKQTKALPVEPPNKKIQKPKKAKTKVIKERKNKAQKPTLYHFQCDYCQKTVTTKTSIRRHINIHLGIKPYNCEFCKKGFSQLTSLKGHAERNHRDYIPQTFICNVCHKPFLLKEDLALHIRSHIKKEKSFKCFICNRKFSDQVLLSKHEKRHHVTAGRYKCSICNMSYDCKSQLALHVKKHLNIKDYMCQYCGKDFLRLNSVRRHIEICHSGARIQCPICFKNLKGHLTEHLRTHDNKRPHVCPDCGQRFTQATQLTVHRRSHTGARPYPCRICDRPFTHSNALMLHIRRHTGEKPFQCAMCPNVFSQLNHMKAHMKKIHGKELPYKCSKCNEFFKLKTQLDVHAKSCTVGDPELTFDERMQAELERRFDDDDVPVVESAMSLSRMRFLLALLLTMIATKEKLKYLGFNKRLIDDLLIESLEAMGQIPSKDQSLTPIRRLKTNIQILLNVTIPPDQMQKFQSDNKTTEELLELLTDEKKNE